MHYWRVDPTLNLTGKVRIIDIEDFDANPCSGTHTTTTGEAGPFALVDHRWRPAMSCHELVVRRQAAWTYWYGEVAVN